MSIIFVNMSFYLSIHSKRFDECLNKTFIDCGNNPDKQRYVILYHLTPKYKNTRNEIMQRKKIKMPTSSSFHYIGNINTYRLKNTKSFKCICGL